MPTTLTRKGFIDPIGNIPLNLDLIGTNVLIVDLNSLAGSTVAAISIDVSDPASPSVVDTVDSGIVEVRAIPAGFDGSKYRTFQPPGITYTIAPGTIVDLGPPSIITDGHPDMTPTVLLQFDVSNPSSLTFSPVPYSSFFDSSYLTCFDLDEELRFDAGLDPDQACVVAPGPVYIGFCIDSLSSKRGFNLPGAFASGCGFLREPQFGMNTSNGAATIPAPSDTLLNNAGTVAVALDADISDSVLYVILQATDNSYHLYLFGSTVPYAVIASWAPASGSLGTLLADGDHCYVLGQLSDTTYVLYIVDNTGALVGSANLNMGAFQAYGQIRKASDTRLWVSYDAGPDIDIVDISDLSAPSQIEARIFAKNFPGGDFSAIASFDVDLSNNLLYTTDIASGGSGMFEFAIWSLLPPVPPGPTIGDYACCHALGDYLYGNKGSLFVIWNIATPSSPVLQPGSVRLGSKPIAMWASSSVVYCIDDTGVVYAINVDNPNSPKILVSFATGGNYAYLFAFGYMVVLSGSPGLLILDFTDYAPKVLVQDSTAIGAASISAGRRIFRGDASVLGFNAQVYNDQWGGFYCEAANFDSLSITNEIQAESLQVRHVNAKGSVTAHESFIAENGGMSIAGPINMNGVIILSGDGSPERKVAAPRGSFFLSKNGKCYLKKSGNQSRGWKVLS